MAIELVVNRVKNPSDLDWVAETCFKHFKEPNQVSTKEEYREMVQPWLDDQTLGTIIAYDEEGPVGLALYRSNELQENEIYKDAVGRFPDLKYEESSKSLEAIIVEENHRRQGIGAAMVAKMVEECKASGAPQIYAICWKGPVGDSYPLLTKLGFRCLATMEKVYCDGSTGSIVMKDLTK